MCAQPSCKKVCRHKMVTLEEKKMYLNEHIIRCGSFKIRDANDTNVCRRVEECGDTWLTRLVFGGAPKQ